MTFDETCNLIRSRRAIRRFSAESIPTPLLNQILETAMWSPSAHNRQPWRFAVLQSSESLAKLANAMGERLRKDRTADGDNAEAIERDVARSFARITGAAVAVVVCMTLEDMDVYPDERRNSAEKTMAIQSVSMAAQSLWLAAHAAGLGCCWLCAPLFVPDLVRKTCELPSHWQPQGLMTLGWPDQTRKRTRRDWQDNVRFVK